MAAEGNEIKLNGIVDSLPPFVLHCTALPFHLIPVGCLVSKGDLAADADDCSLRCVLLEGKKKKGK